MTQIRIAENLGMQIGHLRFLFQFEDDIFLECSSDHIYVMIIVISKSCHDMMIIVIFRVMEYHRDNLSLFKVKIVEHLSNSSES